MLQGINVNDRIEFISKHDKDDPKTIFILRPLTADEVLKTANVKDSYKSLMKMLELSIVEIKNFEHTEIKIAIESLSTGVINELLETVNKINHITDDEAKN